MAAYDIVEPDGEPRADRHEPVLRVRPMVVRLPHHTADNSSTSIFMATRATGALRPVLSGRRQPSPIA